MAGPVVVVKVAEEASGASFGWSKRVVASGYARGREVWDTSIPLPVLLWLFSRRSGKLS